MICMCLNAINQLPGAFANLNANLGANLNAKLNAAASLAASANAALAAHASAAQLGLGASLSASLNAKIMAQLTALASFNASLRATFGINLTSPSAAASLQQLFDTLVANALAKALGQLPVSTLPQLNKLANLANAALSARPDWV